jgi:hypothetical protein
MARRCGINTAGYSRNILCLQQRDDNNPQHYYSNPVYFDYYAI